MAENNLIIVRTPLRISFFGGGTDFKKYYEKKSGGVITCTINKYIYVIIKKHNDFYNENFRLGYSNNEKVLKVNDIKNNLVRAVLKYFKIKDKLIINIISDIPSRSGLGSSSACLVGLINAISIYLDISLTKKKIAEIACKIEIDILKSPIGVQDQYSTCFGGFNHFKFTKSNISINHLKITNTNIQKLRKNSLLVWTGGFRESKTILKEQSKKIKSNYNILDKINQIRLKSLKLFSKKEINIYEIGLNLHESWNLKKKLSSNITNKKIDQLYSFIIKNGAIGGKLCGAGSCGFIFFIVDSKKQKYIKSLLPHNCFIDFNFADTGSELILKS